MEDDLAGRTPRGCSLFEPLDRIHGSEPSRCTSVEHFLGFAGDSGVATSMVRSTMQGSNSVHHGRRVKAVRIEPPRRLRSSARGHLFVSNI